MPIPKHIKNRLPDLHPDSSIFKAMADRTKRPDAAGYQAFAPHILKAMGFKVHE